MAGHPELVRVVAQRLDTAVGELTTELVFRTDSFSCNLSVVVFLSRALPTVVAMEIVAAVDPPDTPVVFRPASHRVRG